MSGSAVRAATASGSREKSSFLSFRTGGRGARWLKPLIAASAKPGAGTWKAKLSQMSRPARLRCRGHRQAAARELLRRPLALPAVRVDSMADHQRGAGCAFGPPAAQEDLQTSGSFESLFRRGCGHPPVVVHPFYYDAPAMRWPSLVHIGSRSAKECPVAYCGAGRIAGGFRSARPTHQHAAKITSAPSHTWGRTA